MSTDVTNPTITELRQELCETTAVIASKQQRRLDLLAKSTRTGRPADVSTELDGIDRDLVELERDKDGLAIAIGRAETAALDQAATTAADAKATLFAAFDRAQRELLDRHAAEGPTLALLDAAATVAAFVSDLQRAFPEDAQALTAAQRRIGSAIAAARRSLKLGPMSARAVVGDRPWRDLIRQAVSDFDAPQNPAFFNGKTGDDADRARAFTAD